MEYVVLSFQNIYSKIPTIKFKSNGTAGNYIKKWLKRIIVLVVVLIVIWLIVLLCFWLYGSHLASEWTKEDERREAVALKDITKADSIARELFKESAEEVHLYNQLCWKECGFNHIERGIAILRNAAEKVTLTLSLLWERYMQVVIMMQKNLILWTLMTNFLIQCFAGKLI